MPDPQPPKSRALPGDFVQIVPVAVEEVGDASLGDDDALGAAGGAGGVDDVGGVVGAGGDGFGLRQSVGRGVKS